MEILKSYRYNRNCVLYFEDYHNFAIIFGVNVKKMMIHMYLRKSSDNIEVGKKPIYFFLH